MKTMESKITKNSLHEYQKRINTVLNYIDENLDSELSVEILSNVSNFSMYHFHRIFHALIGENVNSYVKRLRLMKAAHKLIHEQYKPINDIALECGFSSHSDFSRSFKEFYKTSPSQYSLSQKFDLSGSNNFLPIECNFPDTESLYEKNISIRLLDDLHIAYIRLTGLSPELKSPEIEKAFKRLYSWAKARELISSSTIVLGITMDSPEVIAFDKCRYDACITVPCCAEASGDIGIRHVKAKGKYIVYRFSRISSNLSKDYYETLNYIYGHWMPYNGYIPEDKPFIEFHFIDTASNNVCTDFCIPIKPL